MFSNIIENICDSATALVECRGMVSVGDTAAAFARLRNVLIDAAKAAGCKHIAGGRPSQGMRRDMPYLIRNVGACDLSSDMQ